MSLINRILENYGQKSRIIIMVRHGEKTLDGKNITPECLDQIIRNGVPGITNEVNTIQHGSFYPRTDETVCAITLNLLRNGAKIVNHLPADNRLANPNFFNLFTLELKEKIKKAGLSHHEGLKKFHPEQYNEWTTGIDSFIFETLAKMNPGDVCLIPSHTPVVEMTYDLFADKPDPEFLVNELEYIFVIQAEQGGRIALKQNGNGLKI